MTCEGLRRGQLLASSLLCSALAAGHRARRFLIMEAFRTTSRDKDSDGALVTATKRGDTRAFEQLVSRHEQRALAMAQRITRNREDAEDVVQESFLKAFRHLASFEEKAQFSSWLTRIVMNEAYMLLRQKRRVMEVLPDSPQDSTESTPDPFIDRSPSPEESCWRRERKELFDEGRQSLAPNNSQGSLAPRLRGTFCRRNGSNSPDILWRCESALISRPT